MLREATTALIAAVHTPRRSSRWSYRLPAAALTTAAAISTMNVPRSWGVPGRLWVVFFLVAAPLVAIARLLPHVVLPLALLVGAAGAAVVNSLVAQVMLSADAWSPRAGVAVVGIVAALIWLLPTPDSRTTGPPGAGPDHDPPGFTEYR